MEPNSLRGAGRVNRWASQQLLAPRLEQVEEHLTSIETAVHRQAAWEEFDKELASGGTPNKAGD